MNWYKKALIDPLNPYAIEAPDPRVGGEFDIEIIDMGHEAIVMCDGNKIDRFNSVEEAEQNYPGEKVVR